MQTKQNKKPTPIIFAFSNCKKIKDTILKGARIKINLPVKEQR